jgi:hypothetical protein
MCREWRLEERYEPEVIVHETMLSQERFDCPAQRVDGSVLFDRRPHRLWFGHFADTRDRRHMHDRSRVSPGALHHYTAVCKRFPMPMSHIFCATRQPHVAEIPAVTVPNDIGVTETRGHENANTRPAGDPCVWFTRASHAVTSMQLACVAEALNLLRRPGTETA